MYFSSDEKANVIIGEAAMNLFTAGQEVNVEQLINELLVIEDTEKSEIRLSQLQSARQWLMGFKTRGSRSPRAAGWLASSYSNDSGLLSDDIVFKH